MSLTTIPSRIRSTFPAEVWTALDGSAYIMRLPPWQAMKGNRKRNEQYKLVRKYTPIVVVYDLPIPVCDRDYERAMVELIAIAVAK